MVVPNPPGLSAIVWWTQPASKASTDLHLVALNGHPRGAGHVWLSVRLRWRLSTFANRSHQRRSSDLNSPIAFRSIEFRRRELSGIELAFQRHVACDVVHEFLSCKLPRALSLDEHV
jgi:hypothetical protein